MDAIKQILKDYGPALGPALAFIFGLLALLAKYQVDRWAANWRLSRRLRNLERLVTQSGPPDTFFPSRSSTGLIHADEARNLLNLTRFYSRLLALKPVFDGLADDTAEDGTVQQIAQFHAMKWWYNITLKQVEEWRATETFRMSDENIRKLQDYWKYLHEAAANPESQHEYIYRRTV